MNARSQVGEPQGQCHDKRDTYEFTIHRAVSPDCVGLDVSPVVSLAPLGELVQSGTIFPRNERLRDNPTPVVGPLNASIAALA